MYFMLDAATTSTTSSLIASTLPFLVVIAVMYFMLIRPQKKREKKLQVMRNSIEIGDGVTTVGGIVGRVISIKEDTIVVETASAKIRFKRWAVSEVEKLDVE